jgi:predicted ATP-dependent serine protease
VKYEILPGVLRGLRYDMEDCPDYFWSEASPHPASARAVAAMFEAAKQRTESYRTSITDGGATPPPRWSTTVEWVDQVLAGGFYGFSVVGGMPGLGKSVLSMACAIEAAASLEWNVLFFNAEMGDDVLRPRLDRYLEAWPGAADAVDNLSIVAVPRGFTMEDILSHAVGVCGDDRPVLTIFDSINTCATLMEGSYLDNLREIVLFSMMSRRISRGAASFLCVSELNRGAGVKGMNAEYWADVVLKILGEKERGWVRMKLQKSRATAGEREERKMVRVIHTSRFLTREQLDRQRQAGGDPLQGALHLVEAGSGDWADEEVF